MNTFAKFASAAAVVGLMAVSMATPSQAAWRHHSQDYRSAVTTAPGYGAYAYAPRWNNSDVNESACTMSPGSQGYQPCYNR